ncbi:hypothetical protein K458DRAFT_411394 [Lentithecium fluviatile CBS 122367]|uniref:Uncharacterized protein n=1 Tax=Lentithecium fluviatile CBS 122367 TaxID=1168545 RepID=A0A6G1JM76_9PLEO|nr:hypothetical protein K458DRAFT_411394 [Lentithecium fluviatile CBS 122367]
MAMGSHKRWMRLSRLKCPNTFDGRKNFGSFDQPWLKNLRTRQQGASTRDTASVRVFVPPELYNSHHADRAPLHQSHHVHPLPAHFCSANMAAEGPADGAPTQQHSILNTSFPVLLPFDESLFLSDAEFQAFVQKSLSDARSSQLHELKHELDEIEEASAASAGMKRRASGDSDAGPAKKALFVAGLEKHVAHRRTEDDLAAENKTLTENADVTNISSKNVLVDLFYDLGESTESDRLKTLLNNAWKEDSLMTLKIIFNARSIHLGKANKIAAYKAFGWLAENHPNTLLTNLSWLVRPVIEKKKAQKATADKPVGKERPDVKMSNAKEPSKTDEDEFDMIDADEAAPSDPAKAHDVRFGVSHGYWKDLLNLVVFSANDQLKFDGDPSSLLCQQQDKSKAAKRQRVWDPQEAKDLRKKKKAEQHAKVVEKLQNDAFYRALHLTVARLFAVQLKEDGELLKLGKKSDLRNISLAAKWSPTFGEFHDKHTFILSSIAEILYPNAAEISPDAGDRELYLRHAREACRMNYVSPLRKALSVVEREITAQKFSDINYERVPSVAMDRYSPLFLRKDFEHFSEYVKKVASGSAKISGATLLPSTLVSKAREIADLPNDVTKASFAKIKASVEAQVTRQVIDGQWKTLVQRVKDSGALGSSIAVCDVSGSMGGQRFRDKTCPMDSSIGLSLLVSEVTAPPFGGGFITFSETPTYVSVGGPGDQRGFAEKVKYALTSDWGYNTNFTAVFEDVVLPMAQKNNIKQEDMVQQVFVFSDMQFDEAGGSSRWTSSFERIKAKYAAAGYEMPRLIFWNLAGTKTDKPVTNEDENTALVSGYSQGMLKVFLDGGGFEEEGEEELVEEAVKGEDGIVQIKKKKKIDPMTLVKKAVSHKAYEMLEVVD